MSTRLVDLRIAALLAALAVVLGACGASPTPPSAAAPSSLAVAQPTGSLNAQPSVTGTAPASPSLTTPIDGKWAVAFSRDEMLAVGIVDKAEDDGSNYGTFTLTLEDGRYTLDQLTEPFLHGGGTFEVRGSTFVYTADDGEGPFACAFVLSANTLAFPTVLDAAGKVGPGNCTMPFRAKPWNRMDGASGTVPTTAPSASLAVLPKGLVVPGTYVSQIQPGLTLSLVEPAENDADTPTSWIDLVFEGDSQFEIHIIRLDNVFDPKHPGKVIDLPANLTAWLAKLPGIAVVHPARTVRVGGLDATQLDLRTGAKGIMVAPIPGIDLTSLGFGDVPYLGWRESGDVVRLIVVPVGGQQVVISMFAGGDPRGAHFDATVQALQPVVDSIVWN